MLSKGDDYPIHQTPEPVAHPSTGDRNFYDRYFFNAYAPDGSRALEVAVLRHPDMILFDENCRLLDARTFAQKVRDAFFWLFSGYL